MCIDLDTTLGAFKLQCGTKPLRVKFRCDAGNQGPESCSIC